MRAYLYIMAYTGRRARSFEPMRIVHCEAHGCVCGYDDKYPDGTVYVASKRGHVRVGKLIYIFISAVKLRGA